MLVIKEGVSDRVSSLLAAREGGHRHPRLFPRAKWIELRGNVETRLQKIARVVQAEATLLAVAGLKRLNIDNIPGFLFEN